MKSSYSKDFVHRLESINPHQHITTTFQDFCHIAALALAQPFYRNEQLEKEYMHIVQQYEQKQVHGFAELLSTVILALEENPEQDFLGEIFALNGMSRSHKGQFFTPYPIAKMMAKISLSGHEAIIAQRGYLRVCEPSCGSGVMIIGLRQAMLEGNFNPSAQMLVTCIDIDSLCCNMTYIQLSLLGIAANIVHGDTLSLETHRSLFTPTYFLNDWERRCQSVELHERVLEIIRSLGLEKPLGVNVVLEANTIAYETNASLRVRKGQEQQLMLW